MRFVFLHRLYVQRVVDTLRHLQLRSLVFPLSLNPNTTLISSLYFFLLLSFLLRMRGEEKHRHHHQNNDHYRRHHRLRSFHLHMPQLGHRAGNEKGTSPATMVPPKGWMGIRVGQEGEEKQRFEVPVEYLKHPLFVGLLELAEKEYGFGQKGAITIPCGIEHFRHVRSIMDRDTTATAAHHHLPHFAGCFRA